MPIIGPYAPGLLTIAPYMAVLTLIVRVREARPPFFGVPSGED
jgi:hypothetical protein